MIANPRKKRQSSSAYRSKIEKELDFLHRKYEYLKEKMEQQHLENIQSDELLLRYIQKRGEIGY